MLSLQSPSKINLFLRIIKRRNDSYHELASLFQTINLCDMMHFEEANNDVFTCNSPGLPTDETNLVSKALRIFRKKIGIDRYFSIHLQKNIPQQAGLGGGSSNAATTLWALNFICGEPASASQLAEWGAEIGCDVPFFLSRGTAYCTGRGEVIRQMPSLENIPLWIVKPLKGLSTPEIYKRLNVSLLPHRCPEEALASFFNLEMAQYFNDLEQPAFEVMPDLVAFKKKLISLGFSVVLMSGSGSSFFCLGNGDPSTLSECFTFKARFINREPGCWY